MRFLFEIGTLNGFPKRHSLDFLEEGRRWIAPSVGEACVVLEMCNIL